MPFSRQQRHHGFTLIELSVVLVIIGLIVSAIFVGRSLIRSYQLRSVMTDIQQFESARLTFKVKYNCVPGDCASASAFGLGTNGNGNGYIDWPNAAHVEHWQYWTQMANAGLIQGSYTGVNGVATTRDAIIGTNVPATHAFTDVGFFMYTPAPQYTAWSPTFDGHGLTRALTDTKYVVGRDDATNSDKLASPPFSPLEVQELDIKFDDGLANNGAIRAPAGSVTNRSVGSTTGTAPNHAYSTDPSVRCDLTYWFSN